MRFRLPLKAGRAGSRSGSFITPVSLILFSLLGSIPVAAERTVPGAPDGASIAVEMLEPACACCRQAIGDEVRIAPPANGGSHKPDTAGGEVADAGPAERVTSDDSEKKKKVPKKKKKRRGEDSDKDDDDDEEDDCVSACIGSILADICFSSDNEDELVQDEPYPGKIDPIPYPADTVLIGEPRGGGAPGEIGLQPAAAYEPPPQRDRLMLGANFGWGMFGPSDVIDEYRDGAFRIEVTSYWATMSTFQAGLSLGFQTARGYPQFDYETSTQLDSPTHSRINMFNATLLAGQYISPLERTARIYWGVGPGIYWVKESADLEIYSLPDEQLLREEEVTLEKSRLGADVVFGMDWAGGDKSRLGFLARGYFIPWESDGEKSLSLDFIGKRTVVGFNISFTVAYDRL